MQYPLAFFELQLLFARKRAELLAQPYPQAVLESTALYRILGLDWSFDASNHLDLRTEAPIELFYAFYGL